MSNVMDSLESRRLFAANTGTGTVLYDRTDTAANFRVIDVANSSTVFSTFKVSKTGTLFISGTGRADNISLDIRDGKIVGSPTFTVRSTARAGDLVQFGPTGSTAVSYNVVATPGVDGTATRFVSFVAGEGLRPIKRVVVNGLGGDDVIRVTSDVPVSVNGSRGNDTISVFADRRTVEGGSGLDTIVSEALAGSPVQLIRFRDGGYALSSDLVYNARNVGGLVFRR